MSATIDAATTLDVTSRIERLPFTSWQAKVLAFVGVATFFDAFDALAIAFALPSLIGLWSIKPQQIGLLISMGYVGQLFGAILFGWVADRIGRLPTLVLTILIFAVLSICCALSWSFNSLLIFRLIQGFGLGGEVPIAATYINEIIRAKHRGRIFILYEMAFTCGMAVASFLGYWIVIYLGWRWLFILGGVPALATIFLRWGLPESPRWLASVGRSEAAEKAIMHIEKKVEKALGTGLPEVRALPLPEAMGSRPRFSELFHRVYRRRTLTIWFIFFAAYLSQYGLTTWLPSIYKTVFHVANDKALLYSMAIFIAGLFSAFSCAMLVDLTGRRTWISGVFCIGAIFLLLLWVTGAPTVFQVALWTSVGYYFFGSVSIVAILYAPELYPTRMRATGTTVAMAWCRVASIIGPLVTGVMIAHYSLASAFFLFGAVTLLGGLVTAIFGVETKGRVLEEVSP